MINFRFFVSVRPCETGLTINVDGRYFIYYAELEEKLLNQILKNGFLNILKRM